jgi:segregation and condensation protein A
MEKLNIEIAGEFLVMASTLMQIKARTLLPSQVEQKGQDDEEFENLKDKLAEYQKYQEIGKLLSYKETEQEQVFYRPAPVIDKSDFVLDATIFDLTQAFKTALMEMPPEKMLTMISVQIPLETKIREILDIIEGKNFVSFTEILRLQKSRAALVVSFFAMLKLIKDGIITAKQNEIFGEIRIYKLEYQETEEQEPEKLELLSESGETDGNQ